jgi:hypothetical protein
MTYLPHALRLRASVVEAPFLIQTNILCLLNATS